MKQIKFYFKQKSFSCGPCALRMILETLTNTHIDEEKIIELIGATEDLGAPLSIFQKNLNTLLAKISNQLKVPNRFEFLIKENSNFEELQKLHGSGYLVMINLKKADGQPHWAIFNDIDQEFITVMDPDFGPNYQYQLSQFNWTGGIKVPTYKALIAIKYNENETGYGSA